MKVPYKVSEEYADLFKPPFVVAQILGIMIIVGGLLAHSILR